MLGGRTLAQHTRMHMVTDFSVFCLSISQFCVAGMIISLLQTGKTRQEEAEKLVHDHQP
jgi:hypothetical protein